MLSKEWRGEAMTKITRALLKCFFVLEPLLRFVISKSNNKTDRFMEEVRDKLRRLRESSTAFDRRNQRVVDEVWMELRRV